MEKFDPGWLASLDQLDAGAQKELDDIVSRFRMGILAGRTEQEMVFSLIDQIRGWHPSDVKGLACMAVRRIARLADRAPQRIELTEAIIAAAAREARNGASAQADAVLRAAGFEVS